MTLKCIILFITALLIFISGCGGGSSTINPGPLPTSNPTQFLQARSQQLHHGLSEHFPFIQICRVNG